MSVAGREGWAWARDASAEARGAGSAAVALLETKVVQLADERGPWRWTRGCSRARWRRTVGADGRRWKLAMMLAGGACKDGAGSGGRGVVALDSVEGDGDSVTMEETDGVEDVAGGGRT